MSYSNPNTSSAIIKKQWDYLPHIVGKAIKTGSQDDRSDIESFHCHVTRKRESDYLMDFIRRRREGALLVGGKRGVGKTSVIISAILQARKALREKSKKTNKLGKSTTEEQSTVSMELLAVLVNAPNFQNRRSNKNSKDESEDTKLLEFKHSVLQNLVRALYQAARRDGLISGINLDDFDINNGLAGTKKKSYNFLKYWTFKKEDKHGDNDQLASLKIRNQISYLFNRAVAAEVKTQANLKELTLDKFVREEKTTFKTDLSFVAKTMTISVPSAIAAAFLLPLIGIYNSISNLIPVVISITPPGIAISRQLTKTVTNQTQNERDASIFYLYDYDLSTLQSELEEAINELTKNRHKVIFIIDELDKIPKVKAKYAIESLKSLLNQASALFVIASGQEFYKTIAEAKDNRAPEYTTFSQKIYLRRPQFAEIKKFMDNIVDPIEDEPIIRLFAWNDLRTPTRLEKILQVKGTNILTMFDAIKDIEFSKEANEIKIVYKVDEGEGPLDKEVSIKDDFAATAAEVKIPSPLDKNITEKYDFGVIKYQDESFVYSRTSKYRDFQHYATYAARSDFFDLYNVLRDHITYFSGDERPRLEIDLKPNEVTQAKLQEIIEDKFLKIQFTDPSKWQENDRLLTLMYNLIAKLSDPPHNATRIRIEKTPYKIIFFNDNEPDKILAEVPDSGFYENVI
jgi:hypothetical protein